MKATDHLTLTEVSRRSGYAGSALRYYESLGLIDADRSPAGRRVYERSVLRRLAFVRAATNVGLTLEEIRAELELLPRGRTPTKADWERISRHWKARLDEQIRAIQELRDNLDGCIGCGCLSLQRCRLYNAGDWLAETDRAPGAARLPAVLRRGSNRG